jgi:hypothetical protein
MSTTMLGVLVMPQSMQWISVGDSPLFLFRDGELNRINDDHSLSPLIDARAERGEITKEEAENHPGRHTLQAVLLGHLRRGGFGSEATGLRAEFGQRGINIGLRAAGDDDVRSGGDEFFRRGEAKAGGAAHDDDVLAGKRRHDA